MRADITLGIQIGNIYRFSGLMYVLFVYLDPHGYIATLQEMYFLIPAKGKGLDPAARLRKPGRDARRVHMPSE